MPLRAMAEEPFAFVQLPPVRTEGVDFRTLLDEAGRPIVPERKKERIGLLQALAARLGSDVVIVEHFPFGRRQLAAEFLALIEAAQAANPRVLMLSSVRDVLVTPRPERIAEAEARAVERAHVDARLHERPPERARRRPASQPIVDHVDGHALGGFRDERVAHRGRLVQAVAVEDDAMAGVLRDLLGGELPPAEEPADVTSTIEAEKAQSR